MLAAVSRILLGKKIYWSYPKLTHQSHLNEKIVQSTFSNTLCYSIFKQCHNSLYTRNIQNRFMPSISKSIRNHLHSKLCFKLLHILPTLSTLSTKCMLPMLYFLLPFISALCFPCIIILLSSISDWFGYRIICTFNFTINRGFFSSLYESIVTIWNANFDWTRIFFGFEMTQSCLSFYCVCVFFVTFAVVAGIWLCLIFEIIGNCQSFAAMVRIFWLSLCYWSLQGGNYVYDISLVE